MLSLEDSLRYFDQDQPYGLVAGLKTHSPGASEVPVHQHRQGQLLFAVKGGITCEVDDAIWMVPPNSAVWIPGQTRHSVRATANAEISFLFIQPGAAPLPATCCTLFISPLVRELILHMAGQPPKYAPDSPIGRKAVVLLEELAHMPVERLHLPISEEPRMRKIAKILSDDPADRRTLAQWGNMVAMSERSLARLVRQETGLTFGRWRRQLHLIVALRELAAGQNVQNIAEILGYESVSAFIIMFKKSLGETPAKYFSSIAQTAEP
ncbi:helix-turn-helix transcriptional regulator [Sodalis ligni]|uniref:AraC family transcriptional regulator n=1 Tax=Sodalis ligni TaxID=2697027 RepID=UPI00193F1919|nr:helix-turn-helix transcriptional regulator [Sodalis ligni]QWA09706.1 helix-turn-helix transcriptional regulator [Sodalis ligni]